MALTKDQSDAVRKALRDTGIEIEYLTFDTATRALERTDMVGYLEWCLANGGDRITAQLALDEVGAVRVSTIFTSAAIINGNDWMAKTPFETMAFEDGRDLGMTKKYTSFEEAEAGHLEVVSEVLQRRDLMRPGG